MEAMLMHELTCQELIEFLDDYVEQRLPPARRAMFDDHLFRCCAHCREYLEEYVATVRLTRALSAGGAGAEEAAVPQELLEAVKAALARREDA